MTIVIKSTTVNNYYISMKKESCMYLVTVSPCEDEDRCGYPILKHQFTNRTRALTDYNNIVRRYENE